MLVGGYDDASTYPISFSEINDTTPLSGYTQLRYLAKNYADGIPDGDGMVQGDVFHDGPVLMKSVPDQGGDDAIPSKAGADLDMAVKQGQPVGVVAVNDIDDSDHSLVGNDSGERSHPVVRAFVDDDVVVLAVPAHLHDGGGEEEESVATDGFADGSGLLQPAEFLGESEVLAGEPFVLALQVEIAAHVLAAPPEYGHRPPGQPFRPYVLQA